MKIRFVRSITAASLVSAGLVGFSGCNTENPDGTPTNLGKTEKAIEKAGEKIEEGAVKAGHAIEKAGEKAVDATGKAIEIDRQEARRRGQGRGQGACRR